MESKKPATLSELSILRLRTPKDPNTLDKYIHGIIDQYNKARIAEGKDHHVFDPTRHRIKPELSHNFTLISYYSRRPGKSKIGLFFEGLESKENFLSHTTHYLLFLYRIKPSIDLFALTSNDAWQAVMPKAIFTFPLQIAVRIVDPTRVVFARTSSLTGNKASSKENYRKEVDLSIAPIDKMFQIFQGFKARFKEACSLLKRLELKKTMGIKIGMGRVRITSDLPIKQLSDTLDLFSDIARGKATPGDADDPKWRFLKSIQKVNATQDVRRKMREIIWALFQNPHAKTDFYFMHGRHNDYLDAKEYRLREGGNTLCNWPYTPSLSEVMEALRESLPDIKNPTAFFARFNSMEMDCVKGPKGPLFDYFQGDLLVKGKRYFRAGGTYYQVRASQLIELQVSFYQTIKDHLIKEGDTENGDLPLGWTAREEWTSFTSNQVVEKTGQDRETIRTEIAELTKPYQFVKDDGSVECPYMPYCFFRDLGFKSNTAKKKDKIDELLARKKKAKEKLSEEDLNKVLAPKKNQKTVCADAKRLWKRLRTPRPRCEPKPIEAQKIPIIGEDNKVNVWNLEGVKFPKTAHKGITDNRKEIQKALKEAYDNDQEFTADDLKPCLGSKFKSYAVSYHKKLQVARNIKVDNSPDTRPYYMVGPPPENALPFFKKAHKHYRNISAEEGYNRLYLDDKYANYLTCDQIFAGKQEKIELFDILKIGEDGTLYFYHVKEGFDLKTGKACEQIRIAAKKLYAAIRGKDDSMLRKIYKNIMETKSDAPFRKKAKERLEGMLKGGGEQAFLNLFKDLPKEKIVFVYAFLDTNKPEKFLSKEKRPDHVFQDADFNLKTSPIQELTQAGFLEKGQIQASFLELTQPQFVKKMTARSGAAAKQIYRTLHKYVNQYTSLIAKLEVLNTRRAVEDEWGFTFRICQIKRKSNFEELPQPTTLIADASVNLDESINGIFLDHNKQEKFFDKKSSLKPIHILAKLLGLPTSADPLAVRIQYADLITSNTILKEIDHTVLEQAARLTDVKLVILPLIHRVVQPGKAKTLNDQGKDTLIIVRNKDNFYLTRSDAKSETPPKEESKDFSSIVKKERVQSLVNTLEHRGLPNSGKNNCFLNSALQLLMHSTFLSYFTDTANFRNTPVCNLLSKFSVAYALQYPIKLSPFRGLFNLSSTRQEDSADALGKICDAYIREKDDSVISYDAQNAQISYQETPNSPKQTLQNFQFPIVCLRKKHNNKMVVEYQPASILKLYMPDSDQPSIADAFQRYTSFGPSQEGASIAYLPDQFLVQMPLFKFEKNETTKRYDVSKYRKRLSLQNGTLSLQNKQFKLQGYIHHIGGTPNSGHYTAWIKIDGTWFEFNDNRVEEKTEEEALYASHDAYVVYYKKS